MTEMVASTRSALVVAVSRRPNFQFDLSDIDRARPRSSLSRLGNGNGGLVRSPLDPVYLLPRVEERPVTPPRFVRDSMSAADIAGTRPRDPHAARPQRESTSLRVADIDGAVARARYASPPRQLSSLHAQDINNAGRFVSSRHTDPLQPEYVLARETSLGPDAILGRLSGSSSNGATELVRLGAVEGSKPRSPRRARDPANVFNLRTRDVSEPVLSPARAALASATQQARRSPTDVSDIPGARSGADRDRMRRTTRHTDPNARNYGDSELGGRLVPSNAGLVHVHRHALDDTEFAAAWRPAQREPDADAAGVSMWRNGTFTAGMLQPRLPTQRSANASAAAKEVAALPPVPVEPERAAPIVAPVEAMAPQAVSRKSSQRAASRAEFDSAGFSPELAQQLSPDSASPSAASASLALNLSHPPNTRKVPPAQKRHQESCVHSYASSVSAMRTPLDLLAHPPSNGAELALAPTREQRIEPLQHGLRGPFAVASSKASIESSQAARTLSERSKEAAAQSRDPSRGTSRSGSRPSSGVRLRVSTSGSSLHSPSSGSALASSTNGAAASTFAGTASTLSNAFSLAFVPTKEGALARTLPYSSPVHRPGLGTTALFERMPQSGLSTLAPSSQALAEKKAATLRAEEIRAVRALG